MWVYIRLLTTYSDKYLFAVPDCEGQRRRPSANHRCAQTRVARELAFAGDYGRCGDTPISLGTPYPMSVRFVNR